MAETNSKPSDNTVTIKEVYERVVALEAKLDLIQSSDSQTAKYFRFLAFTIVAVEIVNLILNLFLILWR